MIAAQWNEFFLAVAIVTLLFGGIGVIDVMLVAVEERTADRGAERPSAQHPGLVQCQVLRRGPLLLTGG